MMLGTSIPKRFQRIFCIIRENLRDKGSVCVISRYGSIAPAPATPHTAPTAPNFSALSGRLGVRGFYVIMRARRERVKRTKNEIK